MRGVGLHHCTTVHYTIHTNIIIRNTYLFIILFCTKLYLKITTYNYFYYLLDNITTRKAQLQEE